MQMYTGSQDTPIGPQRKFPVGLGNGLQTSISFFWLLLWLLQRRLLTLLPLFLVHQRRVPFRFGISSSALELHVPA